MSIESDKVHFLRQQIKNTEENLQWIKLRKTEYVQEVDIPLQLLRDEKKACDRLERLRAELAAVQQKEGGGATQPAAALGAGTASLPGSQRHMRMGMVALLMVVVVAIAFAAFYFRYELFTIFEAQPTFVIGEWENLTPEKSQDELLFTEGTRQRLYENLTKVSPLEGVLWDARELASPALRKPTYRIEGSYQRVSNAQLSARLFNRSNRLVGTVTVEEEIESLAEDGELCLRDLQNRLALGIVEELGIEPVPDALALLADEPTHSCEALRLNGEAVGLLVQGNADAAVMQLKEALRLDDAYADAHGNLGVAFDMQQKPILAVREYRLAIEYNPDNPVYYYNLADLRLTDKAYDDAIALYTEAIQRDVFYLSAYNNLAFTYLQSEQPDLALETVEQALRLEPPPEKAAYLLKNQGRAYLMLAQPQQAIAALEDALDRYGEAGIGGEPGGVFLEALYYLAQAQIDDGQSAVACETLERYAASWEEDTQSEYGSEIRMLYQASGC